MEQSMVRRGKHIGRSRSNKHKRRLAVESLEVRALLTSVVINEIHYDPPDKTQRAEFIELYNNSDDAVDLGGWQFTEGIRYRFPVGSSLPARSYLVVAEDPATTTALTGAAAIGPWSGALRNSGEVIELRDAAQNIVDQVDYQRGFPWPTVGDEPGQSIELINPNLDNELGGNWRSAGNSVDSDDTTLVRRGSRWKYFPGTVEPSSPTAAFRQVDFDDSAWQSGDAPIGYGDNHVVTELEMQGNYSTLYLRQTFTIEGLDQTPSLTLQAQYDDGFHLWINGTRLVSENLPINSQSNTATASSALENLDFVEFDLGRADYLQLGENVVVVQLANASRNSSSDAWFDAEIRIGGSSSGSVSPGAVNTVAADNAPPATRKVNHPDGEIASNQTVPVTVKVTDDDGVAAVALQYQVVLPGDYFGRYLKANSNGTPVLNPRYDDPSEWTTVAMLDDGQVGDAAPGDDIYTAVIPANANQHRNLIRYRIIAEDQLTAQASVPYADDVSHNFAYFVYDGVPDWTGSSRPGREPDVTYELDQLSDVATYHLLTTAEDHHDSQHIPDTNASSYSGSEYLWPGTMIYDGQVYDNIRYRARGGVWRYAMGKNMWKFDFNRGQGFQAKNDYGQEYEEQWDKLNFSALIQQGNYLHRGEQGLFESVGFKLFNLAGVESPNTHYVHFRVVDGENESGVDQYSGDFRGLYLAIEQPDGRMLDEHGLPDGNLYKIEGHQGSSNNQGPTQVSDGSDVSAFIRGYRNGQPSAEWWEENLDLERYYSYRTIVEGIHHYDIAYGKNYFYYHNPETGKFQVHPWDLDLTWANNMFGSGAHDFSIQVAGNDAFEVDYQNRVRELVDLLYNSEQTGLLIDEFAAMVYSPGEPSWVDADRAMWDYNPIMRSSYVNSSKSGVGRYYQQSDTDDFAGMVQLMKDYVSDRQSFMLREAGSDRDIPNTPVLTYTGVGNYPLNSLLFETSNYADPQGSETFAGMQWRIAEVTDPNDPQFGASPPMYEVTSLQESDILQTFDPSWTPSAELLRPDGLYRVRVRMQDTDGHWSHWSDPVQFTASAGEPTPLSDALRISELHYHPGDPSSAEVAAGFVDEDEFEFMEFVNVSDETIDLSTAQLVQVTVEGTEEGVAFDFADAAVRNLAPGERLVLVENAEAFALRYGDSIPVAGEWSGKLSNSGERITLVDAGTEIISFDYDDAWYPQTDNVGYSLQAVDSQNTPLNELSDASAWRPSLQIGGSPGVADNAGLLGDFDNNQTVDATDIDLLFAATAMSFDTRFDLNNDQRVDDDDVDYLTTVILQVPRGDANLDGVVSFADFLVLSASFGNVDASWATGDFDGDRTIGFSDFLVLSANFGKTIGDVI